MIVRLCLTAVFCAVEIYLLDCEPTVRLAIAGCSSRFAGYGEINCLRTK